MTNDIIEKYLNTNKLLCVDIGAKGGVFNFKKLDQYFHYIGFEPNIEEYTKLTQKKHEKYLPFAISEMGGDMPLYVTKHASYSSLLKPDFKNIKKHFGNMKFYPKLINDFETIESLKVNTKALDEFIFEENIKTIDFLKLDTQGTELSILKGAKQALNEKKVSVIFTEFLFVDVYKNQNSFSDLDLFLKSNGYEFVDCRFYPNNAKDSIFLNSKYEKPKLYIGGDAVYIPKIETISNNSLQCFKTGIILANLGYLSMSSLYLKSFGLSDNEITQIHNSTVKMNLRKLVRHLIPPIFFDLVKK